MGGVHSSDRGKKGLLPGRSRHHNAASLTVPTIKRENPKCYKKKVILKGRGLLVGRQGNVLNSNAYAASGLAKKKKANANNLSHKFSYPTLLRIISNHKTSYIVPDSYTTLDNSVGFAGTVVAGDGMRTLRDNRKIEVGQDKKIFKVRYTLSLSELMYPKVGVHSPKVGAGEVPTKLRDVSARPAAKRWTGGNTVLFNWSAHKKLPLLFYQRSSKKKFLNLKDKGDLKAKIYLKNKLFLLNKKQSRLNNVKNWLNSINLLKKANAIPFKAISRNIKYLPSRDNWKKVGDKFFVTAGLTGAAARPVVGRQASLPLLPQTRIGGRPGSKKNQEKGGFSSYQAPRGVVRTLDAGEGGINRPLKFSGDLSVVKKGNKTYFYNSTSAKPATSFNKNLKKNVSIKSPHHKWDLKHTGSQNTNFNLKSNKNPSEPIIKRKIVHFTHAPQASHRVYANVKRDHNGWI